MENKLNGQSHRATNLFRIGVLLLTACCSLLTVAAQSDGSEQNKIGKAGTFAITNARIVTVSGATIERGTLIIRDGKIESLGANVTVPNGAEKIDGTGLSVYPGMIDAGTNLGLAEVEGGAPGTIDVSETGDMNSNAKAIVGINPHSSHVNVTRINGITTVLSMPVGGIISGQAAIINLNGSTQSEMALVPTFGLVINFPRITTGGGFNPFAAQTPIDFNEALKRRDARLDDLKKLFRDAENYARVQEAYAKDNSLPAPLTDLKMEAMKDYVRGLKPVIFTAERERDIRGAAKFVNEMKIKAIIMGGQEAWKAADDLKKNNIAVVYTNIHNLPVQDDDAYDYLLEAPAKMSQAGVKVFHLDRRQRRDGQRTPLPSRTRRRVRFAEGRSLKIRHALSGADFRNRRQIRLARSRKNRQHRRHQRRYFRTAHERQICFHQRSSAAFNQSAYGTLRQFQESEITNLPT